MRGMGREARLNRRLAEEFLPVVGRLLIRTRRGDLSWLRSQPDRGRVRAAYRDLPGPECYRARDTYRGSAGWWDLALIYRDPDQVRVSFFGDRGEIVDTLLPWSPPRGTVLQAGLVRLYGAASGASREERGWDRD